MAQKYVTLKIPRELAELIEEYIKELKAGYRFRAEFAKEAIIYKLLEFSNFRNENKSSQ